MRERGLAIAGAVALIAVALLVRSFLAGDGEGGGSNGGSDGGGSGGRPVVACTPDLRAICDALADDGRIAADPPTFDLTDGEAPAAVDAWITWDPAPRIVNENAGSGREVWAEAEPLGSAPLGVLLSPRDRDDLGPDCRWACVTERVSEQWPVGVGDPTSAEGLARWRPLAKALADEHDGDYRDIPAATIHSILDSPAQGQGSVTLDRFRSAPAWARMYIGLTPIIDPALGGRSLTVLEPEPATTATVAVVARAGGVSVTVAEDLAGQALDDALAQVGVSPGGTLVTDDEALGLFHVWSKAR